MKSQQSIVVAAIVGFVLSFLVGIIASVDLGTILVRSFIFAVVAALTGIGLRFLAKKFLLPNDDVIPSEADAAQEKVRAAPVGEMVDITVDDVELPDDNSSTTFVFQKPVFSGKKSSNGSAGDANSVSEKIPARSNTDTTDSSMHLETGDEQPTSSGFSPVSPEALTGSRSDSEDVEALEEVEELEEASAQHENSDVAEAIEELEELEEMPEIGAPSSEKTSDSSTGSGGGGSSVAGVASTSEISSVDGTNNGIRNANSAVQVGDSNSVEIAKAIRTVLLRDE